MGLTLIWGVMNVINLAHGAIIVLGMFVLYLAGERARLAAYGAIPVDDRRSASCSAWRCTGSPCIA